MTLKGKSWNNLLLLQFETHEISMKLEENKHVHQLLKPRWPVISTVSVPEALCLDAALKKPEDRVPGSAVQPAVLGAGWLQESVWHWLHGEGCPPTPVECWVHCQPPDTAPGWEAMLHSRAWRLLPAQSVSGMVTMSEIVLVRIFTVHKIEAILRVEIRDSLCS